MTVPVKVVGLIDARNGLRDAIVRLRGGHGATQDDGDHALAALDIAIGGVNVGRAPESSVPVSALRALIEKWNAELNDDFNDLFPHCCEELAAICDAAEQP